MSALTICNCVLRIKDQLGNAFSTAQLTFQPRKSQIHTADAIYLSRQQTSQAQPGIVVQDLLYIAKSTPTSTISVAYTGSGTAGAEVVTVTSNAISVQIQSGVSTATQVKAAIDASAAAAALVNCVISGTAGTAQTTASAANLSDYYAYLALSETTTDSQVGIFSLDYNDGNNYGSIIFDPVEIPAQSFQDLSSLITVSRG